MVISIMRKESLVWFWSNSWILFLHNVWNSYLNVPLVFRVSGRMSLLFLLYLVTCCYCCWSWLVWRQYFLANPFCLYGSSSLTGQVILHFLGTWGFRLLLMLLEAWSIYMSTQSLIMCIEISRQVTSCWMDPLGQRFSIIALIISFCFMSTFFSCWIPSSNLDLRFWFGKTCWENQWWRSISDNCCWNFWLSSPRVSWYAMTVNHL